MKNHLIKNIHIKDFKCFDDFKADGFARVNLIGGKNNVGKTAFLEACSISLASSLNALFTTLRNIKYMRENLNILSGNIKNDSIAFLEQSDNVKIETNINNIFFNINEKGGIKEYWFKYGNASIVKVNVNEFSPSFDYNKNVEFLDNFGLSNGGIITNYSYIQKKDKETYINELLKEFDSEIEVFKVFEEAPHCKIQGKYLPITELGDGTRHFLSIITSLYKSENGYLFIDEIDNGIHYTMLENIWDIVLKLSEELNVQVFATTHSKECIEAYSKAAQKRKDEDITYTILTRLDDGLIDAGVYDSEMLTNTLEQDHEVRGW